MDVQRIAAERRLWQMFVSVGMWADTTPVPQVINAQVPCRCRPTEPGDWTVLHWENAVQGWCRRCRRHVVFNRTQRGPS